MTKLFKKKLRQNSQAQIVKKLINSYGDKTKNSNCAKTKERLIMKEKNQIVNKLKNTQVVANCKNSD